MKKLTFGNKIVYFFNSVFAVLLLLSFAIPYIKPSYFPLISALSLLTPVLLIINFLFLLYWLLGLKKQLLLSLLCLLLGFNYATVFFKFNSKSIVSHPQTTIMSYNVRLFNRFNWIKDKQTAPKLLAFVKREHPNILCMQEYRSEPELEQFYPYKYIYFKDTINKNGLAIFSKFPIVNKGSLNFKKTLNNAIFVDLVTSRDTIRLYNIHLESLHLNPKKDPISTENSERLFKTIGKAFSKQENQVDLIKQHLTSKSYKTVICGDFNNTAFSWAYKNIRGDFNDAFSEAGSGFGTTFNFNFIPLRIDFILTDPRFDVLNFKTFGVKYSDHFPIKATLNF